MNTLHREHKILVQFDGMCILCSRTIQLILKADRKKKFLFQTLQQTSGEQSFDTVIVTDRHASYFDFDAVLKIGYELGGFYSMIGIFRLLPRTWRRKLYYLIAENRFKWFGKRQSCYRPTDEERERFI